MKIYISGQKTEHGLQVPLSSAVIIFVANYCQVEKRPYHICLVEDRESVASLMVIPLSCVLNFSCSFISCDDVPEMVQQCAFPVVQDEKEHMVRCGLCCTARHVVKISHEEATTHGDTFQDLLGFRAGCLKACAEVSGWTKLCEVELLEAITQLATKLRQDKRQESMEIPEDMMKLELHFDKPPLLHNDDKKKRQLLKTVLTDFENKCHLLDSSSEASLEDVTDFFNVREQFLPHGNMYYRVQTQLEKEDKKFVNSDNGKVCKFGCTENKLIKWCARCNDRERLRRKEEQQLKNNARLETIKTGENIECSTKVEGKTSHSTGPCVSENDLNAYVNGLNILDSPSGIQLQTGVMSLQELTEYVKTLDLNDIIYEHMYAEGICFTLADIFVFVYIYFIMERLDFKRSKFLENLPNVKKWLSHIISLPRIQQTSHQCGFKMAALQRCLAGTSTDWFPVDFTIPPVTLDVEEDNPEIGRSAKAKHRALKREIARVLEKIKMEKVLPTVGKHPCGSNVQIEWESVPYAASPKIELPEKRVGRKCEQLENLATAVKAIAKPGDVIVDFCSGAGHLGIIIAYLLPACKVYLIENKEESLSRARDRVLQLELDNVVLYQCNLDYFRGHFDIGVCLHACGVATDLVLQQCLDRKAAFVICPCCYGSIQNTHLISYPRSQYYKSKTLEDKDIIVLGHAADQTEENMELYEQGHECMNLVDTDRARLAIEQGYSVTLCSLQPLTCTPKNNLLVGTRSHR